MSTVGTSRAWSSVADICAAHPAVELVVSESGRGLVLDLIRTPADLREAGLATAALRDLLDYADQSGQALALTPEPLGPGCPTRRTLMRWYTAHGFRANSGPGRDLAFRESLIRRPRRPRADAQRP